MKKILSLACASLLSVASYAQQVGDGVLRLKTADGETTSVLMKNISKMTFEEVTPLTMDIEVTNITQTSMDIDFPMPAGCSKWLMCISEEEFQGTDKQVVEEVKQKYNDVFTSEKFLRIPNFKADTQYYIYAVMYDADGVVAGLAKTSAKTLAAVQDEFAMSVTEIGKKDAVVTIVPKDKTMTYYYNVISAAEREQMLSMYDGLREAELDYLKYCAEQFNCDLDFYLSQILQKGDVAENATDVTKTQLVPNTQYYLICFGIDATGKFTTSLYEEEFTTEDVTPSENEITVAVSNITSTGCDYTVTTTNNDPYIVDMQTKQAWENALAKENGDAKKAAANMLQVVYGGYADNYTHTGNYSGTASNSMDDRECVLIVCGYDAGVTTDVQIIPVTKADAN